MNQQSAEAGPSRPRQSKGPFVAVDHKPARPDGKFRVVLVSTGSVASVKIPDIVGALSRSHEIELQIVATKASLHFYDQARIDEAIRSGLHPGSEMAVDGQDRKEVKGVRIWKDEDEWSDWNKLGDPILHIELRRWADLVVIAPCSADFLAKLAAGFSDNLALSMMRALTPDTPVILCPAMNTHMYQHPFTADHLKAVQERLKYMISGPQGAGILACGDEGVGKMTDWRDIVSMIENFGSMYIQRLATASAHTAGSNPSGGRHPPVASSSQMAKPTRYDQSQSGTRPSTPPTPGRPSTDAPHGLLKGQPLPNSQAVIDSFATQEWRNLTTPYGGDGSMWSKRWWMS